jgi:tRNA nucleotidyltransferase/poly(A) polymerase
MKCKDVLDQLLPLLSKFGEVIVAGGAARDELMGRQPKDFDVFVLWSGEWDFELAKSRIIDCLGDFQKREPAVDWHKSEPYLVSDLIIGDAAVQVLVSPHKTWNELLDSFDWNTCLFSFCLDGFHNLEDHNNIKDGASLKLHRITYPISTLRRGYRFSERFKMKFERSDLVRLCQEILAAQISKEESDSENVKELNSVA